MAAFGAEGQKIGAAEVKRNNLPAAFLSVGALVNHFQFAAAGNGVGNYLQLVVSGQGLKFGQRFAAVDEFQNAEVGENVAALNRTGKTYSFQRGAAAERHIKLAGGKSAAAEVNVDVVEGFALAFVNGDGPSQTERKLSE